MAEWLESLVPWGIEVIVWVQAMSNPFFNAIFKALTFLGNKEFYLLVLPIVYWCVHRQTGMALGYASLLSAWLNDLVKHLFKIPRPEAFDARVRVLAEETIPSFPSGHAQNAVVNWGYLAYRFRNRNFAVIAVLLILGIGLSRIVLGVHFPQDVIGGWLIGLVLLLIYIWAEPPVERWLVRQSVVTQLVLAAGMPVVLIFLHPADTEGLYPAAGSITPMSALVGLGLGIIMERQTVRFRVDGPWEQRGLRFLVGMAVVGVFYLGPRLLLPEDMAYGLEAAIRFVRYALVGWAVAFLAPWLFVRMGLAGQETP
jgi:membrane-associated phospholipid phosphatase